MNSAILPRDTSTLQAMVVAQQAEIEHLNLIIAKLRRMQFGQSSEKIDEMVGQLDLALEELETGKAERAGLTEITPAEEAPGKPVRKPLPDHLPRDTVVHAPEHACCPDCGGHLKPLGEDVSEVLDYVPASFRVIRHVLFGRSWPAVAATPSFRPRWPAGRLPEGWPGPDCWPMCWSPNTATIVCYERDRRCLGGSDALPKMRVGPSESACRSRLQTTTSCGS
jgi:hypothetical protein